MNGIKKCEIDMSFYLQDSTFPPKRVEVEKTKKK